MQLPSLALALALLAGPVAAEGPFRVLAFEEALALAQREEKLVFVDFFTTWCGPCKKLDRITWKDPAVVAWLEEQTVPLKVDAEKERQLAWRYGVGSYPTLLFIEPDGKAKGFIIGFREPAKFLSEAKDILAGVALSVRLRELLAEDPQDPSRHLDLARQLEREKDFEGAAEHYLWSWDHGLDDPGRGFGGVRGSFLVSDLSRMMRVHPPFMAALQGRRNRALATVLGAEATRRASQDLALLNKALGQRGRTLETYDALCARAAEGGAAPAFDPRPLLFEAVIDLLLKEQRYADAVRGFGDPEAWLERRLEKHELVKGAVQDEALLEVLRKGVLDDSLQLYEALVGTGQHDAAGRALAARLVALQAGPKPWIELMYAARRAGRRDLQEELRAGALAVLPLVEHRRIPKVKDRKRK